MPDNFEQPKDNKVAKKKKSPKLPQDGIEENIILDISDKKKSQRANSNLTHRLEAHVSSSSFSSPLPPAELLAQYNIVLDNGASKVYDLIIQEQNFRHSLKYKQHEAMLQDMKNEKDLNTEKISIEKRGQTAAITLSICTFITIVILGLSDHDRLAGAIGVTSLGTLAIAMLKGKDYSSKDNIETKNKK